MKVRTDDIRPSPPPPRLDKVLRSLGFSSRPSRNAPACRIYDHRGHRGRCVMLPEFLHRARVFSSHHLITVRNRLDNFGLADRFWGFSPPLQNSGVAQQRMAREVPSNSR